MKLIASLLLLFTFSTSAFSGSADKANAPATKPQVNAATGAVAKLVFYRPKRFYGGALTPSVFVNGEQVARLDNGRYFVLPVKPGMFRIESSMKQDPLEIEVKAGKTEFMEMAILTGVWKGGGRFIPTAPADAMTAIKKLKPLDKKWVQSDEVTFDLPAAASAGTD